MLVRWKETSAHNSTTEVQGQYIFDKTTLYQCPGSFLYQVDIDRKQTRNDIIIIIIIFNKDKIEACRVLEIIPLSFHLAKSMLFQYVTGKRCQKYCKISLLIKMDQYLFFIVC